MSSPSNNYAPIHVRRSPHTHGEVEDDEEDGENDPFNCSNASTHSRRRSSESESSPTPMPSTSWLGRILKKTETTNALLAIIVIILFLILLLPRTPPHPDAMGKSPPAWGCYAQWYRMAASIARPKPLICPVTKPQTPPVPSPPAATTQQPSPVVTSLYQQSLSSMLAQIDSMSGLELMTSSAMEYITSTPLPPWAPAPTLRSDIQHLSSSSPLIGKEEPPYYHTPPPEGVWTKETRDRWEARSAWAHTYFRETIAKVSEKVRRTMLGENVGHVINEDGSTTTVDPSRRSSIFDIQTMVVSGAPNHRTRMDLVMASWAEQFPANRFTIISDSPDDKGVLPVTVIPGTSGYQNSQRKWLAGLKELWKGGVLHGEDAPHFFMIADDDGYVHVSNLMQLVNELDYRMPMIIGEVCPYGAADTKDTVQLQRICGGGGWLISLAAAKLMEPYVDECQQYHSKYAPGSHEWSDTFIGACLKERLGSQLMFFDSPHFISIGPTEMMPPPYDSPRLPGAFRRPSPSTAYTSTPLPLPSNFWRLVTHHYVKPWQSVLGLWRMENAYNERTNPNHLKEIKRMLDFVEETKKVE